MHSLGMYFSSKAISLQSSLKAQSSTTWSKKRDTETSTVLIAAKMKEKTKPWVGEPGRWHSKVEDCLEERRGRGQRSSSLGTALLTTAVI